MRRALKLIESLVDVFSDSVICIYIKVQVLAQNFIFRCLPCSNTVLTPLTSEYGKQNTQTMGI